MKFSETYPLKPFQSTDSGKLQEVIARYPLATVISQQDSFPVVSQLPLVFDAAENTLRGHLDRNNPHCAQIENGGHIYCLFSGPNHYMSPSIYPDTQYPGWNYVAVHVEGTVQPVSDPDWLAELLFETASRNEPADSGYRLSAAQENFHTFIRHILGFEISVTDIRGIFKLAQDKGDRHAEIARKHLSAVVQRDFADFLGTLLAARER